MARLALIALLVLAASCRCNPPIHMAEAGFRIDETEIDFGRVLEGEKATLPLHVVNTGATNLSLTLAAAAPFAVPATLDLPGGATVAVSVDFNAGTTHEERTLSVKSSGGEVTVTLKGTGVHPLDCVPSAPCRESHYVLETNTCVETVLADGQSCTPTSTCLERGQCLGGLCQGVARSCDDNNRCTSDGCAEGLGCVNSPRPCPPPTAPCHVSTCDPGTGCAEAQAQDGTPCGSLDCVNAHLCVNGTCVVVAPPDGTECAPATPCQGKSSCHQGVCVRPDAGVMQPELSLTIGGAPPASRPMLLSFAGQLFGEVCGYPLALPDAGAADGGADAGADDAGQRDAGFGCVLLSYTNNGFERFTEPFRDERERVLLHVSNLGAALLDDGGLEVRSLGSGALRYTARLEGSVHPRGVANSALNEPWLVVTARDGGVQLVHVVGLDGGGVEPLAGLDASVQLLALDELGGAWVWGDGGLGYLGSDDAGHVVAPVWAGARTPVTETLATSRGYALAGNTQLAGSLPDAGFIAALSWVDDAGMPLRVLDRFTLMNSDRAFVFYRQCPGPMSCPLEDEQLRMRTIALATGLMLDDARIAPPLYDANVVEASLLEIAGFPPGVAALVQLHRDAGYQALLELTVGSMGDLSCPLPPGTVVAGAAIGSGYLWAYDNRDGGPYMLEAYPLTGLPLSVTGWPLGDGLSGQRRAR